jgi:tRNA(adenine34) deaminase
MGLSREAIDKAMMARCIELSRLAVREGEYPFATVIALDGEVVAEATNRTVRETDVSRHAEVIALSLARKTLGLDKLRRATLYSNIEPCAMCSYCIRETWVGRVVYAIGSPVMGGVSKWNILRDDRMSERMPQVFGAVPEVVSGVLYREAQQAWREWNPVAWELIKLRGLLTEPRPEARGTEVQPAGGLSVWQHLQVLFARVGHPRTE